MLGNIFNNHSCDNDCSWIIWIIILFLLCGNGGNDCGCNDGCGGGCGNGGGFDGGILIILLIFLLMGNDC